MFSRPTRITRNILDRLKNKSRQILHIVSTELSSNEIKEINRYLDAEDRRHYHKKPGGDDVYSVTTILDQLEEDTSGLEWWKKHNDGEGDNPYWKHILEYKQDRGTLAHHAALSQHNQDLGAEKLWSGDEQSSLDRVYRRDTDQGFLYSIAADRGWVTDREGMEILQNNEEVTLSDILYQDLDYFTQEYQSIAERLGINEDTVEAVEEMFVVPPNHEHDGYGGQADLVYRDPLTGGVVVADLKTSSKVRSKHKHQAAAYAKAVEKTDIIDDDVVERAEVIRINPDSRESEVYSFSDFDQYWSEFAETTKKM